MFKFLFSEPQTEEATTVAEEAATSSLDSLPEWMIAPAIGGYRVYRNVGNIWVNSAPYEPISDQVFPTLEDADRTIAHLSQSVVYRP